MMKAFAPPRPVPCRKEKMKMKGNERKMKGNEKKINSTGRTLRKTNVEILNGRLPLEHSSDWRETLSKRVSGDLQHFFDVENFVVAIFKKYM